ncbi:MAG: hypothetical protein AAGD38_17445 [Acidobacteriota bacterium]
MLIVVVLAFFAQSAGAAKLEVSLEPGTPGVFEGLALETWRLEAYPERASKADVREKQVRECDFTEPCKLLLVPGVWWLRASSDTLWIESRQVLVADGSLQVALSVWRSALIEGVVVPPEDTSMPSEILVRFEERAAKLTPARVLAMLEGEAEPGSVEGIESCPIDEQGVFSCRLPAVSLDLRFRVEPFVSLYRWDVELKPDQVENLGTFALERGASVVGWVATEDGSSLTGDARVEVVPAAMAKEIASDRDSTDRVVTETVRPRDHGFFHIDGMRPGEYQVTAQQEPYGPASARVTVLPNREAQLAKPLILRSFEQLTAVIDPPVDPTGEAWTVSLARLDVLRNRTEHVATVEAGLDGWLEIGGLVTGEYMVQVTRPTGASWASRRIVLGEEPMPLSIELDHVVVSGSVLLGDEPLPHAEVYFGTRFGAVRIEARADEDGAYSAVLPRRGTWSATVAAEEPRVEREIRNLMVGDAPEVELDIELPDTVVHVEVVDGQGEPVPHSLVDAVPIAGEHLVLLSNVQADELGQATIHGLSPATWGFSARSGRDRESAVEHVDVEEDREHSGVTLVLEAKHTVRGRVVSSWGPVPGARVLIRPAGSVGGSAAQVRSGVDGRFEFSWPSEEGEVGYEIYAPGFALTLGTTRLVRGDELELVPARTGGTLVLPPTKSDDRWADAATSIRHAGVGISHATLVRWAREQEGGGVAAGRLVVPQVVAGPWEICQVSMRGDGALPSDCQRGTLQPLGFLDLSRSEDASDE